MSPRKTMATAHPSSYSSPIQAKQVSSRGCSRAYVICLLWHVWEHVRLLKAQDEKASIAFPLHEDVVARCLQAARKNCNDLPDFVQSFGGTEYCDSDEATFWSLPHQFSTWSVSKSELHETRPIVTIACSFSSCV